MTDIDLDALEATARAATPGPWELDGMGEDEPEINYWAHLFIGTVNPNESGSHEIIATSEDRHGPDAQHIAAFDPPTSLALIARLREAEAETARLRDLSGRWLEAVNAPGFTEAVEAEARAYHDGVCLYRERLREAEAVIAGTLKVIRDRDGDPDGRIERLLRAENVLSRYKTTRTEGNRDEF